MLFPPLYMMERMAHVNAWVTISDAQFYRGSVQFLLGNLQISPGLKDAPRSASYFQRWLQDPAAFTSKLGRTAQTIYGKSRHYRMLRDSWTALLEQLSKTETVSNYCAVATVWLHDTLGIKAELLEAKTLLPERPEGPTEWMLAFAPLLNAENYIQGPGLRAYFSRFAAARAGVRLWEQDFHSISTLGISTSVLTHLFTRPLAEIQSDIDVECREPVYSRREVFLTELKPMVQLK